MEPESLELKLKLRLEEIATNEPSSAFLPTEEEKVPDAVLIQIDDYPNDTVRNI